MIQSLDAQNTLTRIQTPQTYIHFTHMLSEAASSWYHRIIQDNKGPKKTRTTPIDVPRHPKRTFESCVLMWGGRF